MDELDERRFSVGEEVRVPAERVRAEGAGRERVLRGGGEAGRELARAGRGGDAWRERGTGELVAVDLREGVRLVSEERLMTGMIFWVGEPEALERVRAPVADRLLSARSKWRFPEECCREPESGREGRLEWGRVECEFDSDERLAWESREERCPDEGAW